MTEANQLPDKPSELIRVALDDLKKCEASPDYEINMSDWHLPSLNSEPICFVCLAGAVMAQSLGADPEEDADPSCFRRSRSKLDALDAFRKGCVDGGLDVMGIDYPSIPDVAIPHYVEGSEAFHMAMRGLADILEGAGL